AESQIEPYRTYGSRLRHRPQSTAKAYCVSVEFRTMRFPSIGSAILQAGAGARRFPWTLAASLVATGAAMTAIAGPERAWHLRLLAVAVIGLSTLTAVTSAAERAGALPRPRH